MLTPGDKDGLARGPSGQIQERDTELKGEMKWDETGLFEQQKEDQGGQSEGGVVGRDVLVAGV